MLKKKPKINQKLKNKFKKQDKWHSRQVEIRNPEKTKFETQFGPSFLHKIRNRFTRETKMSPRGPSLALKSQTPAFKKP